MYAPLKTISPSYCFELNVSVPRSYVAGGRNKRTTHASLVSNKLRFPLSKRRSISLRLTANTLSQYAVRYFTII